MKVIIRGINTLNQPDIKTYKKEYYYLPRVFISCYKDDFDKYFIKIVSDILNVQDCNVYYLDNYDTSIEEYNNSLYLSNINKMNLFVFVISMKYLTNNSVSSDIDYSFAKNNNIPMLPIFVEPNLSELFNAKYGCMQALFIDENINGECQFKNKLNNYLKSVLSPKDIILKIKSEFDKYIFLSYRKKDVLYVREIMSIIHSFDFARDVAIWYDWNLTPGRNFNNEIRSILTKSDLVMFVITPNILDKDNYIYKYEYPYSIELNKSILPIELADTDRVELKNIYNEFNNVIKKDDINALTNILFKTLFNSDFKINNEPEHLYYIGLAYINAIDVERDLAKGINLLKQSASNNYVPAIKELINIYSNGIITTIDYIQAIEWQKKLLDTNDDTLDYCTELNNLAYLYNLNGMFTKAIELNKKCYGMRVKNNGENSDDTLISLLNLATSYGKNGDNKMALNLTSKAYTSLLIKHSIYDKLTAHALGNLATCYRDNAQYEKAKEYDELFYQVNKKIYGEKHPKTIYSLFKLGTIYGELGEFKKSMELNMKCYELRCEVLGEKHPDTLSSLDNVAVCYSYFKDYSNALETNKKCYELKKEVYGENHPETLLSLNNLGSCFMDVGDYANAIKYYKKCHELKIKIYNENHFSVITTLSNLGTCYIKVNKYNEAFALLKKCYDYTLKEYGDNNPKTMRARENFISLLCIMKEKNIRLNTNIKF